MMALDYYGKLRLKIVAMTLGFSLIPLFVLGVTIYYQFSTAYTNQITERLGTMARNRHGALELFFDERVSQLITVANSHSLDQLMDETYLGQLFNIMQSRSKSYIDLGVIGQNGAHLAYVGPHYEELKPVNYGHEDWFNAVMTSGVYISDVYMGFRKIPHFIIAVTRRQKNRTWILRATINSDIIDSIVRGGQIGKKGDAFIVNRSNVLQTEPRFSGQLLGHPTTPDFSSAVGLHVEKMDSQGEETLFATSQLTNPKWVIVIRQDSREEMTPLSETRYIEVLILAAGVMLVVMGTIFTTRSITGELIKVESEKAASDRIAIQSSKMAALGKMAAGVAHEINNPLQIIGDQAGWMKDLLDEMDVADNPTLEELQNCIKKILRHVDRCRSVTHRLLRFGRRMEPTQESVDINAVIAETLTFLENEATFRDIEIKTSFAADLPLITTDQAQLQQVFLNIIDNAIDAVGKAGSIDITTRYGRDSGREVVVEIADSGPGIPKEMQAKIFDPFFSTKSANEGTGLGLSISYSIIEKLGGHIRVASEVGKGTTFTILLPVA